MAIRTGEFSMVDSTKSDSVLAVRSPMNFSNMHFRELYADLSYHLDPDLKMYGQIKQFSVDEVSICKRRMSFPPITLIDLRPSEPAVEYLCRCTKLRIGRTRVDMDVEVQNIRRDTWRNELTQHLQPISGLRHLILRHWNKLLPKPLPMVGTHSLEGFLKG
ncbi:MAG: hypothetical protein IPN95_20910 [Bacteroidetes bacterium]|nr:hypothetical protein [Bacteroidota bacterium]